MKISKNHVVSVNYKMYDSNGVLIDENQAPIMYLHGGYQSILPAVEAALEGKAVGEKLSLSLMPHEAFGDYDADLIKEEDISLFPPDIEIGMMFETEDEEEGIVVCRVTDIDAGRVTLDMNHPLAGKSIRFETEVLEIRAASAEEIAHGHVHGPDEHHTHH